MASLGSGPTSGGGWLFKQNKVYLWCMSIGKGKLGVQLGMFRVRKGNKWPASPRRPTGILCDQKEGMGVPWDPLCNPRRQGGGELCGRLRGEICGNYAVKANILRNF